MSIFNEIWQACDRDQHKLDATGASDFGGCFQHPPDRRRAGLLVQSFLGLCDRSVAILERLQRRKHNARQHRHRYLQGPRRALGRRLSRPQGSDALRIRAAMIQLRFVTSNDPISAGIRAAEYGFWASHVEA
jgi:hypothetical protein